MNCNDYKSNTYSCGGEDGIIEFLLTKIEPRLINFVIEFGAADGFHCSNTAKLWKDGVNCDALLIESDLDLYHKLVENTNAYERVVRQNEFVVNIDDFTTRVADVCSIDVDGNDYHIAERMQTPHKIVIIEHNPTIPPHVEMVGIEGTMYGSSAKSIDRLMTAKGYTLVAVTKTNMIFLYGDHRDEFVSDLDVLFDRSSLNYVVTSYDGIYDYIGEFGYGFSRPGNLRLHGGPLDKSPTLDAVSTEYFRQMVAITEGKNV